MPRPPEDWAAILERVLEDDPLALLKVSRLLNSFLDRWNAYDFRGDWDDLIQETVLAATAAVRDGKLRDRAAAFGYLKSTARFKFVDRLKVHLKHRALDPIPWEDATDEPLEQSEVDPGTARDLRRALDALPERERAAVVAVHLEGRTYDDAASATGIPLGTLKRALRTGLGALRESLDASDRPP